MTLHSSRRLLTAIRGFKVIVVETQYFASLNMPGELYIVNTALTPVNGRRKMLLTAVVGLVTNNKALAGSLYPPLFPNCQFAFHLTGMFSGCRLK